MVQKLRAPKIESGKNSPLKFKGSGAGVVATAFRSKLQNFRCCKPGIWELPEQSLPLTNTRGEEISTSSVALEITQLKIVGQPRPSGITPAPSQVVSHWHGTPRHLQAAQDWTLLGGPFSARTPLFWQQLFHSGVFTPPSAIV